MKPPPAPEAQGPLAPVKKRKMTQTAGDPLAVAKTGDAIGAHEVFQLCIERARNLVKVHEAAHGKAARPEQHLSDLHRASIVLAISALDAYVRAHVLSRITQLLADRSATLPPELQIKIKHFLKEDGLLDAARRDDLLERVNKAFAADFEKKSFQGTDPISWGMKLVGIADVFKDVAVRAGRNEETLRADLERFTKRRHTIAHRGDYDMSQNPPKEIKVTKKDATDCIALVVLIAEHINAL